MLRNKSDIAHAVAGDRFGIRQMLLDRQRELLNEIHRRVKDVREEGIAHDHHVVEQGDTNDAEPVNELAFALIQMKSEVLDRINEALRNLEEGTYGFCIECDEAIAASRLRALPFAVRCRDCEQAREDALARPRVSGRLSGRQKAALDTFV